MFVLFSEFKPERQKSEHEEETEEEPAREVRSPFLYWISIGFLYWITLLWKVFVPSNKT